jgi:hypothetical protein
MVYVLKQIVSFLNLIIRWLSKIFNRHKTHNMKKNYKLYKSVCLLLLLLISTFSFAQTINWSGKKDTDWYNNKNWDTGNVPTATDNVVIPLVKKNRSYPLIGSNTAAVAKSVIILDPSASLTMNSSSNLNINGDFTNNGTFSADPTSVVNFTGNSTSVIDGTSTSTFGILNINKDGGATVTNSAPAFSAAVLNVMQGNLVISASDANYNIGGDIVISLSGTLTSISSPVVNLSGSWTNYGTFTAANSTVDFNGTTTQTINGTLSGLTGGFYNLTFNGSGSWTNTAPMDVANTLTMTSGTLTIGANAVKIQNNLTVSKNSNLTVQSDGNLLQVNDAGSDTGSITAQRLITYTSNRNQYNYLSSPVNILSVNTIYSNISRVLSYNEATDYFYAFNGAPIAGQGLAVKLPTGSGAGSITANYNGVPNNGITTFPLGYTSPAHGFNLVGNPYPSNIDLNLLYNLPANAGVISSTFYLWDNTANIIYSQQGSGYGGSSYAVFNAVTGGSGTGVGAPNDTGKAPNNIAKVGQGFIVQSLAKNTSLTFNNSIRTSTQTGASFFSKSASTAKDVDRFYLDILTPSKIVSSAAIVYFVGGNNAFANDDSEAFDGISDGIYTVADAKKLVIQGKASFINTDILPLVTHQFNAGLSTIRLSNTEGIFTSGQNIYLKDNLLNTTTNLSSTSYTFDGNAGETSGRFEIVYLPSSTLGIINSTKADLVLYRNGDQFVIKSPKDLQKIEVYDASGRLIDQLKAMGKELIIPAETWLQGLYILKINFLDGSVVTKKVIK